MNKWALVLGVFFLFQLTSVFASCADPRLIIEVPNTKTSQGGVFDVNLTLSANPPPLGVCVCTLGQDCGLKWQYLKDGDWTTIPSSQSSDLNCSGSSCSTGTGYPIEDHEYSKSISCAEFDGYLVRGYVPALDQSTREVRVYCYQDLACIPPEAGNFYLNQSCTYKNTPVWVDQNFNILSGGQSINHNSDVNFFSSGSHFLNIQDGGRIDLNQSMIFAGLNNVPAFGALFFILFNFLLVFGVFRSTKKFGVLG